MSMKFLKMGMNGRRKHGEKDSSLALGNFLPFPALTFHRLQLPEANLGKAHSGGGYDVVDDQGTKVHIPESRNESLQGTWLSIP